MKNDKYIHVEIIEMVGKWENHTHHHHYDQVIKTKKSAEEVASRFSIEVYPCKRNGVSKDDPGVYMTSTDRANAEANRERAEHYKELFDTSVWELHFEKCQGEDLLNVLTEIENMGDPLIAMVCKNAKEKHHINKLVHARKLFPISYL